MVERPTGVRKVIGSTPVGGTRIFFRVACVTDRIIYFSYFLPSLKYTIISFHKFSFLKNLFSLHPDVSDQNSIPLSLLNEQATFRFEEKGSVRKKHKARKAVFLHIVEGHKRRFPPAVETKVAACSSLKYKQSTFFMQF